MNSTYYNLQKNLYRIDLLIITPSRFKESSQELAELKNKLGYSTLIKEVETIENEFDGVDLAEKIRNCIKFYHGHRGVRWVILLGDEIFIPQRIAYVRLGYGENDFIPTDYYYADLDGDWNFDHDATFGELEDSLELRPDVLVGRIPVHTEFELLQYLEQLKVYKTEGKPWCDIERALFVASELQTKADASPYVDSVRKYFPPDFHQMKLYQDEGTITREAFVDSLNKGTSYHFAVLHGDYGGIYINVNPYIYFSTADINLLNEKGSSLWYVITCDAGGVDKDCFAEHLVFHPQVIGIITNTRNGFTSGVNLSIPFYQSLFDNPWFTIGEADSVAKERNASQSIYYNESRYNQMSTIILVDPSLVPPKGTMHKIKLENLSLQEDTLLELLVTNEYEEPFKNVKVTLYQPGNFIATTFTNLFGYASLRIKQPVTEKVFLSLQHPSGYTVLDSLLLDTLHIPLSVELSNIQNNFGDTLLVSNTAFKIIFKLKNNSLYPLGETKFSIKEEQSILFLDDTLFHIPELIEGAEYLIKISGKVKNCLEDTIVSLTIQLKRGDFIRSDTLGLRVFSPKLSITSVKYKFEGNNLIVYEQLQNSSRVPLHNFTLKVIPNLPFYISSRDSVHYNSLGAFTSIQDSFIFTLPTVPYTLYNIISYNNLKDTILIPLRDTTLNSPIALRGEPGSGSVKLSWNTFQNLLYNVYRSEDGVNFVKVNGEFVDDAYYEDRGLKPFTYYYYYVTMVDTFLHVETTPQETLKIRTNPANTPGWPRVTIGTGYSTPCVLELDVDVPGLELIIGTSFDSLLYAFYSNGDPVPGWPVNIHGDIWASPCAADFDNDGADEVFAVNLHGDHKAYLIDGDGSIMPGWPQDLGYGSFGTPACYDLDGDGKPEIVVKLNNSVLYVFRTDGSYLFAPDTLDTVYTNYSSPAIADINGDSIPEIVVAGGGLSPHLYVFEPDGDTLPPFPIPLPGRVMGSMAIGDVRIDYPGEEIVIPTQDSIYLYSSQGQIIWSRHASNTNIFFNPSLSDINDDGILEVLVNTSNGIIVFDAAGNTLPGFPVYCGGDFSTCATLDIDGDGTQEIIKGSMDGNLYAIDYTGNIVAGFPVTLYSYVKPSVFITDHDLDGLAEIVASSFANSLFSFDLPSIFSNTASMWPTLKHDKMRTSWIKVPTQLGMEEAGKLPKNIGAESDIILNGSILDLSRFPDIDDIKLYDLSGRLIYNLNISKGQFLDLSRFSAGIYFLHIKKNNNTKIIKVIKIK